MAKQSVSRPLEGKVSIVGVRPRVSLADRDAPVADVSITLTGGSGRTPVPITFSVGLNVPLSGRARLTDDATGAVVAESTRSGGTHVFKNVPVVPPGSRTRIFRITNVRANASGLCRAGADSYPNCGVRVGVPTVQNSAFGFAAERGCAGEVDG